MSGTSIPFMRLLTHLRWLAVAGQSVTIFVVTGPMHVTLPAAPLWAGVAALALFNGYATWRSRTAQEATSAEILSHMLADVAVLTWQISWSGGIENPFSSLFLLPIALAILALRRRWAVWIAVASALGYGLSAILGRELPHVHGALSNTFGIHMLGMLVNFLISAIVLVVFLTRMTAAWRESEHEVGRLRERFARNEGIVALATHAASVAHELNTPLGTLTLMVDDLIEDDGSAGRVAAAERRADFTAMKTLLEVCRDRVRELAAPAEFQSRGDAVPLVNLERVIEQWQLVRPTIDLRRSGCISGHEQVDSTVGHLLQVLLNNAADSAEAAGMPVVDLRLEASEGTLVGDIRDYGAGFDPAQRVLPGTLFRTSKPHGLGIGLALSHATVERLGGDLSVQSTPEGRGVHVAFRLPVTP